MLRTNVIALGSPTERCRGIPSVEKNRSTFSELRPRSRLRSSPSQNQRTHWSDSLARSHGSCRCSQLSNTSSDFGGTWTITGNGPLQMTRSGPPIRPTGSHLGSRIQSTCDNHRRGSSTAYATKITPEAQRRLCEATGITPPEWKDREFPEHELRQQKTLTGRNLEDILSDGDILSRRPYVCFVCRGSFTVAEYWRIQLWAEMNEAANPFESNAAMHESCGGNYPIDNISSGDFHHFFRRPS